MADGLGDDASLLSGTYFDPAEDRCRPEFGPDCDTETLLRRYGVPTGNPQYGVQDIDSGFDAAYRVLFNARQAFDELPDGLKSRYGSVEGLIAAMDRGEFTEAPQQDVPPNDASASSGGASSPPAGPPEA